MTPRPPPKISLKYEWERELGSEHAQRPEVVQSSRSFQSNQPILDPCSDRTVQPVVRTDRTGQPVVETHTENVPDGSQTRSLHESIRFNVGDETLRERSGQPVVNRDESGHEQTMLNEVNMDFRIPGLPTFCCEACAEHKRSRIDSEN